MSALDLGSPLGRIVEFGSGAHLFETDANTQLAGADYAAWVQETLGGLGVGVECGAQQLPAAKAEPLFDGDDNGSLVAASAGSGSI